MCKYAIITTSKHPWTPVSLETPRSPVVNLHQKLPLHSVCKMKTCTNDIKSYDADCSSIWGTPHEKAFVGWDVTQACLVAEVVLSAAFLLEVGISESHMDNWPHLLNLQTSRVRSQTHEAHVCRYILTDVFLRAPDHKTFHRDVSDAHLERCTLLWYWKHSLDSFQVGWVRHVKDLNLSTKNVRLLLAFVD